MANLVSDQEIKNLLEKDLLELIGGADLPPQKKQELYAKMAETVQNRVIARIYDQLSEEEGQELDKLIDSGDKNQVDEFLKNKNLDITSLLTQEAIIYKAEMVNLFKANRAPDSP
jgi:hypothetical protein